IFPQNIVDELWNEFQLKRDQQRRLPGHMSGGERQRVALIRALAYTKASVYLLDEPLSGVGAASRRDRLVYVRRSLKSRGAIAFLVTHDPVDAVRFGDRVFRFPSAYAVPTSLWTEMEERACTCATHNPTEGRIYSASC